MKNTQLLIIDPQNDFCDIPEIQLPRLCGTTESPALAVPGANADMLRLSGFIERAHADIQGITVTLDSHPYLAIERTTFWKDAHGKPVEPFTVISADSVKNGQFIPAFNPKMIIEQLVELEDSGRKQLVVWPVHCVTGTWGHNIHTKVSQAINAWECATGGTAQKVLKGEYPWTEHYGVFQAETPQYDVPSTQFNETLARSITNGTDLLFVAGEASSHCVAASVEQLMFWIDRNQEFGGNKPDLNVVLLTDCMSPVPGFKEAELDFMSWAKEAGVLMLSTENAMKMIKE